MPMTCRTGSPWSTEFQNIVASYAEGTTSGPLATLTQPSLKIKVQARARHALLVQLVKRLALSNSELLLPGPNLTLPEKPLEAPHRLVVGEARLLHVLEARGVDHTFKCLA